MQAMSNLKIYKKDGKYFYKDNGVINEVSFGGTVSPSEIAEAVGDYLTENPVEVTWSGLTGKPETFPPSTHSHTKEQIEQVLTGEISSHTHAGGGGLSQAQVLARGYLKC
jgi:hypothetical protein